VILAFLSVVFGEIIPKRIGLVMPERIAVIVAYPMIFLSKVAFPIVWMFSNVSSFMLKILKLNNIKQTAMSEEEVKEVVVQSIKEGGIAAENGELIENVLHLDKRSANAIMTTRADFYYIDINAPFEKNYETLVNSKFSKVLVMNEETEEIFGYVYLKNILPALCAKDEFNIMDYVKQLIVLPETVTPIQILSKIKTKSEAALIINEYGENIGLVCLSDVLEALVGDVDVAEEDKVQDITQIGENKYLIDGELDFKQLEKLIGASLEEDPHVNTVSGLVMKVAAEVPKTGYKFEIYSINNKKKINGMVVDMDKNFVDKIEIEITDVSNDEIIKDFIENES
jgi:putative hemolysin